jgi:GNAT superfamily N-acetyltransferase
MLPSSANANIADMERIADIINSAYAECEKGFWLPGEVRTTVAEMSELTGIGEMAVARLMGQIVGCVRVRRIDQEMGELGMLSVDPKYQGQGIGRELVRFAEERCRKEQLRKTQLELLVSKEGHYPIKVILENWYVRLGYQVVDTKSVEALFPHVAQKLAIPCNFLVFHKELI